MNALPVLLLAATVAVSISGCAPLAVGGVATAAAVAHDRRTTGTVLDDNAIEIKAYDLFANDPDLGGGLTRISATGYNGMVLLTGEAPTAAQRERAAQLVAGLEKVRGVHNELTIGAPASLSSRSSDALLTTRVKSRMTLEKGFDPTRAKVVSNNGVVYLMGLVTRREADIATELTRTTSGVQRVVRLFEYVD